MVSYLSLCSAFSAHGANVARPIDTSDSVVIFCNSYWEFFIYREWPRFDQKELFVRLSYQKLFDKDIHRCLVKVDILPDLNFLRGIMNYSVMSTLILTMCRFICLPTSGLIVDSRCKSFACRTCRDVFPVASVRSAIALYNIVGTGGCRNRI